MGRRLSDPSWKSGPPEPKHTHHEHDIDQIPDGQEGDLDGFGVEEAEKVEGKPLVAIQERHTCRREGCDASLTRRLLFTTHTLTEREERALDRHSAPNEPGVFVHENAERVDVESIHVDLSGESLDSVENSGGAESSDVVDITISAERIIEDEPHGQCHGVPEPPSHEPYGL